MAQVFAVPNISAGQGPPDYVYLSDGGLVEVCAGGNPTPPPPSTCRQATAVWFGPGNSTERRGPWVEFGQDAFHLRVDFFSI